MNENLGNLNFKVILSDEEFNSQINQDIAAAEKLNTSLSTLLEVKAKTSKKVKVSVDATEAYSSLEKLNEYFIALEKADLSKVGQKLDVTPQVEQALLRLKQLEEEIEVINQLRMEEGGGMELALALKEAQKEADNLLATIAELRQAETALNGPDQFKTFIHGLSEQSMEMKQLIAYYQAEEKASEEAAKEKAKEEKERQKNAKAIEKERRAMANGIFKEHIASLTAANPTLKEMAAYYKELEKETNKYAEAAKGASVYQSRIGAELKSMALSYLSIRGASQILSSLVRITGEFELQRTTLAAMIGDLNKAEQIVSRIQGLAVESPFQFKELTTYAKQLSAFAVPVEELYDTTKMLADVSAGLGVGMDRIVLAYGQVRSAAFLRGQEVRQFTEAGIPILDELAKQFTELEGRVVSTGEVFDKISARLVPFEMVAKVFKDMTSEGGKFYNMQEIQAETLKGKLSNLKDAYEVMLNEIGQGQSEKLKDAVDWLRKLMQNYEEVGETVKYSVITFGLAKTAIEMLNVATGNLKAKNIGLIASLRNVGAVILKNPYAALGVAVTTAVVGLHKYATALSDAQKLQKSANDSIAEYNTSLAQELGSLEQLYKRMELAKEGTLAYDKAKAQIQSKYSTYIDELKKEGVAVDNLANIYSNLAQKIQDSLLAKSREDAMQSLDAQYKETLDKEEEHFEKLVNKAQKRYNLSFTVKDKEILRQYVFGGMTEEEARSIASADLTKFFDDVYNSSQIRSLKGKMQGLLHTYFDQSDELLGAFGDIDATIAENAEKSITGWRKTVQDTLTGLKLDKGHSFGLWAEDATKSTEYIDDMVKRYKELQEEIKMVSPFDEEYTKDLEKNKNAIEAVAKALNIDIKSLSEGKGKSTKQKEIETQIDLVKKLQDAYEKLKPYISDDIMAKTLKNLFPEAKDTWLKDFDFSKVLISLSKNLEAYDKPAAEALRNSVSKDIAAGFADGFKNFNAYKKLLAEWKSMDFNLEGKGVELDFSKIIRDLNNEYAKIDQQRLKALESLKKAQLGDEKAKAAIIEAYGEEVWDAYIRNGEEAINTLVKKEKEGAREVAYEKSRDLATKYVAELDLDLTGLHKKSTNQIKAIIEGIESEIAKAEEKSKEAKETAFADISDGEVAEKAFAKWQMFEEVLKLLKKDAEDAKEALSDKEWKNAIRIAERLGKSLQEVGNILSSLGSDFESSSLTKLGEQFSTLGSTTSSIVGNIKAVSEEVKDIPNLEETAFKDLSDGAKAGIVGILAAVATYMVDSFTKPIKEARKYQDALTEASRKYLDTMNELRRESHTGVFGTDEIALAAENMQILNEANDRYAKSIEAISKVKFQGLDMGGNAGTQYNKQSLTDILDTLSNEQGWDLYNKDGQLNIAAIESYYDSFKDRLTRKQRLLIEELIESGNAYQDAANEQAEYLTSLFSGVADSIADSFIESFKESGNAALDYGDIMDGIATKVAKDMIKNALLQKVFTDEMMDEAAEKLAKKDAAGAMAIVNKGMEAAEDLAPYIQQLLESLKPYMQIEEKTPSGNLSEGIKGMTEDTANLLASYINAMRSDVSQMRAIQEHHLPIISAAMPTIMDHLAQIQANTFDTAVNTSSMLARLVSIDDRIGTVIDTGNNGDAIKVLM
jgi:hypothetical protein